MYETYYDIRYPGHEREAGRPLRTSAAYPWHVAVEIDIFGEWIGGEIAREPLFDPQGARMRSAIG